MAGPVSGVTKNWNDEIGRTLNFSGLSVPQSVIINRNRTVR